MKNEQLTRSGSDRMCLGVAGGLAEYSGIDPVIVRLVFVLTTLYAGGVGLLIYLVLALLMPEKRIPDNF